MYDHNFTLLVTDDDLYMYDSQEPYDEGYLRKVGPTNIHRTVKHRCTIPLRKQYKNLPREIVEDILLYVANHRFKCRQFKDVLSILQLCPKLFTKFYLQFFPKESNTCYMLYFDSYTPVYQDRMSRMLYLIHRIHQILQKPSHECTPYFLIEIIVSDHHSLYPILPWTIVSGKIPQKYELEIHLRPNEFPEEDEMHLAYVTGPVLGDVTWVRGIFYNNQVLLASTAQRPVIPIIFTGQYEGLYKGETILLRENSWIFFTYMIQYIYGEDAHVYVGDSISEFDYKFYDTLDPRFLQ